MHVLWSVSRSKLKTGFLILYLESWSIQGPKSRAWNRCYSLTKARIGMFIWSDITSLSYQNLLKCLVVAISLVPIFLHPQSVFSISNLEHTNKNILISFTAAFGFLLNDNGPLGISKGLPLSLCPPDSVLPSSPVSLCRRLGGFRDVLVLGRDRCAGEPTLVASSSCLE